MERLYLDWVNNFLTVKSFAEYYDLTVKEANETIDLGREVHEGRVRGL
tara:strand:+ start:1547 stop:1690 length:144 start_codon:yes stop_codon:yes gene_type:complete